MGRRCSHIPPDPPRPVCRRSRSPTASNMWERQVRRPSFMVPAIMGPPETKMGGDVHPGGGHEQSGHVLVAVGGSITRPSNWWAIANGLGGVGDQIPGDQGVLHAHMGPWRCRHTRPMAGNSTGVPPAARTPAFTASAILSRFMWPGTISL